MTNIVDLAQYKEARRQRILQKKRRIEQANLGHLTHQARLPSPCQFGQGTVTALPLQGNAGQPGDD